MSDETVAGYFRALLIVSELCRLAWPALLLIRSSKRSLKVVFPSDFPQFFRFSRRRTIAAITSGF
jgi:hypothetical protein